MSVFSRIVFDAAVWGPARRTPGRTVLSVLAIALGVALGLAIYLINRAAADEVSLASRSLFGLADLAVEGTGDGFDEMVYPRIAMLAGVAAASPVVEVRARLADRRSALTFSGVDMFRARELQPSLANALQPAVGNALGLLDSRAVFVNAVTARNLNLDVDDTLAVQVGLERVEFNVAGLLPASSAQEADVILDIATAQWRFERLGKLTRLNIRLAPGADAERTRREIAAVLPPGVRITTPGKATDEAVRLSRAYRSNLTALALVALFTGGFLVYSTQSLTVLRRYRELAILHALGVTRGEQAMLTLCGGALVGVLGAVLGLVLGYTVARLGLQSFGADLGAGYFRGEAPALQVRLLEWLGFGALGVIAAMLGTLKPAIDAARTPTAAALKAGDVAGRPLRTHGVIVIAVLLLALALLPLPSINGLPLAGYASIGLLTVVSVMAMPLLATELVRRLPKFRPAPYEIAVAHLRGTTRFTSLSLSAVVVSFSLMVAMAIMVFSFRMSLDQWMQKILPADLYVRSGFLSGASYFSPQIFARLGALPGVTAIEGSRYAEVSLARDREPITLIARPIDAERARRTLWLESTAQHPAPTDAVPVWVSQAAADLFSVSPDATLTLAIADRQISASVRGIWRDYQHLRGAVIIDRDTYARLSGDDRINSVSLWLAPDSSVAAVQAAVRTLLPQTADYEMRTPKELRGLSLRVFDRTFAVTYLLEGVAVLIGLLGISAGASAQVLARRGEFGVLRHLGFTRGQIAATLAIEGAGAGFVGVCAGLLSGGVVSLILIHVINRQSFHWSMDLAVPIGLLVVLSIALIALSAGVAVLSGRQAMSGDVVRAVKEDW